MKIGYIDINGNINKEFYEQGYIYKDTDAFENNIDEVCYVPELSNYEYKYEDFLNIAEGNKNIATEIFETVDWQCPETVLNDWFVNGEIARCTRCNSLFFTYGNEELKYCTSCLGLPR